jgi:K+ transporter
MEEKIKKNRNLITYLFKINTNTIQGRITIPFFLAFFLGSLLFYLSNVIWKQGDDVKKQIIEQIIPVERESFALQGLVHTNQKLLFQWLYNQNPSTLQTLKVQWRINVKEQKDKLKSAIYSEKSSETDVIFNTLNQQIKELENIHEKIINLRSIKNENNTEINRARTDLQVVEEEIQKNTRKIIFFAQNKIQKINEKIETERNYFGFITTLLITLWFLGGYGLGIYMFRGIFKWIREIRNQMKEISYGNLPPTLKIPKHELRGLVKNLNLLLENLKALRTYAENIGKGDFKFNQKIFGYDDKHINKYMRKQKENQQSARRRH